MQRFKFVLYRPVQLIPVLFGISIVTFVMIQSIPGDPIRTLLGFNPSLTVCSLNLANLAACLSPTY